MKVATCAAELPGAEAFYREARKRGSLVTCGHSNSTWDEMQRAFDAGMRHVDHFWCAMSTIPSLITRLGTPMRGTIVTTSFTFSGSTNWWKVSPRKVS